MEAVTTVNREKWIDNAKGIAILAVIVGHCSGGLEGIWDFSFVYGFHLVVFFLLAGYTFKKKEWGKNYVNGKFRRLMVPYFYTCLAIAATDIATTYFSSDNRGSAAITEVIGKDLIRSFFASGSITKFGDIEIGTRIGAIWFLPAMFFALVIFQRLVQYTEQAYKLGAITGGLAFLGFVSARFIWLPFSIQSGMMAVFFLWLGFEIKRKHILEKLKWYHYVAAQGIFLVGIYTGYANVSFVTAWCKDVFLSLLTGVAGCMLVYAISITKIKGMARLGRISLTILCVHLYALETMGGYFHSALDKLALTGNAREWALIAIEIVFAVVLAMAIELLKKKLEPTRQALLQKSAARKGRMKRDSAIDIAKGILIILMIVGHFSIDSTLRGIIYSFHMVAFVFFSGYFYRKRGTVLQSTAHIAKTFLLPYAVFVAAFLVLNIKRWSVPFVAETLEKYALGISFARKLFSDVASVGPVYFILMLFVVRVIYVALDHIVEDERKKWCAVILVSLAGMALGRVGLWLPWSIDVAMYAVVFYQLGVVFRKYDVLNKVREHHALYFFLSAVWAYMIYSGGMEIASRSYGQYGIVILGAMAGTLLLYMLSVYIDDALPVVRRILQLVGESNLIILIVHTLLGGRIGSLAEQFFYPENFSYMVVCCAIQVLLGGGIEVILRKLSSKVKDRKKAAAL